MDVLREFDEDPLPPSRVDVARAIRTGRRQRHTRAGVAAISLVAMVSAGMLTAPRWQHFLPTFGSGAPIGTSPDNPGTPALTCDPAAPLPDRAPVAADTEFDVLRRQVDASAVAGYRVENYETSRYWQRLELVDAGRNSTIEVTLYAAGQPPVFASSPGAAPASIDPTTGTSTEPVGQAAAYWLPGRQGLAQFEVARLGWQWAPNAWAFVAAADTSSYDSAHNEATKTAEQIASLRGNARHVATALRLNADLPVTAPFTVQVPTCTRLAATHLLSSTRTDGTPFTRFSLFFAGDGWDSTNPLLSNRGDLRSVEVTADSVATPADKPGTATFQVDGHPAGGGGDGLNVYDVDGFALELNTPGGEVAVLDLFRSVRMVPGAHERQSVWTETPLRR